MKLNTDNARMYIPARNSAESNSCIRFWRQWCIDTRGTSSNI